MHARRLYIFSEVEISKLPVVVKKDDFNKLTSYADLESRSRIKAEKIIEKANSDARLIIMRSKKDTQNNIEKGYEKGMANAKKEMASSMADLAGTTAKFMKDVESRIVDIVIGSVSEIVSGFDDKDQVTEIVRKFANNFKSAKAVTLWVAPKIQSQFDTGISELVAPASLVIKADESLQGAQCRMDNGYMVVDGDSDVQIAALKVALRKTLTIKESIN